MEDMSQEIDEQAACFSELLREHKGQDVSVLDLRGINNWTDFFIIATASSKTHIDGLERHIKEFCREKKIEILGSSRKDTDDEWRLIDIGLIIIHLMTQEVREFYELEKLWAPMPASKNEMSVIK
ncbi:ribosome silencing factor RsfS [Treponema sp. R8-4-B8]